MRDYLPIDVLIGFNPTEPVKLSSLAAPIDDSAIKSGMLIRKATGNIGGDSGTGFRPTADTDSAADVSFFFALHDGDSHDVQAAGKLVGLDCSDQYVIRTGYFDAEGGTFDIDDPLTAGNDGVLVLAGAGDVIVARVDAVGDESDGSFAYTGKMPSATNTKYLQVKTVQSGLTVPSP